MPSGGARVRSGPPPDPNALRRDRRTDAEWTTLPAEGRPGEPPPWPLVGQSDREAQLWARLWAMPQATQWEKQLQALEVALYVRNLAVAEVPGSPVKLSTLVRQQADALGLTIPGLRVNRWRIATPAAAPAPVTSVAAGRRAAASPAPSRSARDRFRVVRGDAAG